MARRKNMKRRRVILGNTFRLIRENGLNNVSLQMIAEKSGISKSLLQSYYPHKSKLISDIVRNLFTTLGTQVDSYDKIDHFSSYAHMKAFIYTIGSMGMLDEGLDRIISQAFTNNDTLDYWSVMLLEWVRSIRLFDEVRVDEKTLESGIAFVTIGVGRLYYERSRFQQTPEELADFATSSLMYSFCKCTPEEIDQALKDGHTIIETADMHKVHHAIDTMFDEGKDIIS